MTETLVDRLEAELSQHFPMVECIMGEPRRAAIAALKAMKNPPPSIKERGARAIFGNQDLAHDAWDQMIDQAIKEGE